MRCARVFFQGNFKVEEFLAVGVEHSGHVEVGSGHWIGNFLNVEKQEAGLGCVWFDEMGRELGGFDLVHIFAADYALDLLARDRNGKRSGARLRVGHATVHVVRSYRREFGMMGRNELDIETRQRNRVVPIVGDDEKNWEEPMLLEIYREDAGLIGRVIGIGGDADFFNGVVVVRGISEASLGNRPGEVAAKRKGSEKKED